MFNSDLLFFFFFLFCFLKLGFTMHLWLFRNSLCKPGWPQTQCSAGLCFQRLKLYDTTLDWIVKYAYGLLFGFCQVSSAQNLVCNWGWLWTTLLNVTITDMATLWHQRERQVLWVQDANSCQTSRAVVLNLKSQQRGTSKPYKKEHKRRRTQWHTRHRTVPTAAELATAGQKRGGSKVLRCI